MCRARSEVTLACENGKEGQERSGKVIEGHSPQGALKVLIERIVTG